MCIKTCVKIDSPCIQVCIMDPAAGVCRGCGRTLAEIAEWSMLRPAEQAMIMAGLTERMRALGLPPAPDR
jgi:uncharacterized protein